MKHSIFLSLLLSTLLSMTSLGSYIQVPGGSGGGVTPNDCSAGSYATGIGADGTLTCSNPLSNATLSGTTTFSSLTATTVPYLNGSKALTSSAVTPTELGYISGLSSSAQTQLNAKVATSAFVTGSVDNALLRADGTGGGTSQGSSLILDDVSGGVVTARTANNSAANSTTPEDVIIRGGNKTNGTGGTRGANVYIYGGNAAGTSGARTGGSVYVGTGTTDSADPGVFQIQIPNGTPAYTFGATAMTVPTNATGYGFSSIGLSSSYRFQFSTGLIRATGANLTSDTDNTSDFGVSVSTLDSFRFRHGVFGTSVCVQCAYNTLPAATYAGVWRATAAATAVYNQFAIPTTTGITSSDGTLIGLDASGNFVINQQEAGLNIALTGPVTISSTLKSGNYHIEPSEYDAGNSSTAITINWSNGSAQKVTMTGDATFTLSNPVTGGSYVLYLLEDGTGSRAPTWPATVKWPGGVAPTLSGANKVDLVNLYWNGSLYVGTYSLNYTP